MTPKCSHPEFHAALPVISICERCFNMIVELFVDGLRTRLFRNHAAFHVEAKCMLNLHLA